MHCDEIEVYLSGYLDGELPQQQLQRVQLHLETCSRCRALLSELEEAKKATKDLDYERPSGQEWKNMENHILQDISRGLGWIILIVWSSVTAGYAGFQYLVSPYEPIFHKILVFGLFLGIGLLFLSVLTERVRESRTDRYKGVQK